MYVEITSRNIKAIKNLVKFAAKNGWDINGVDCALKNYEDNCYLEISTEDLFLDAHGFTSDKGDRIDIKRAKKLLSREILRVSEDNFGVVKSDKGVRIGCTFIKEEVAKQILARIKPLPKFGDYDVQINEEFKTVAIGYNKLTFDEVQEVAEFMGWADEA